MKYKKYPSYKDSCVEWLGEVPEHWNIVRNKAVFQFIKSLVGEDSKKYKLLSLTLKGIILRDIESGKGKFPAEFNTYQKVKKNDLIFCLFDIDETPRTIGISKHDGMITGAYDVARCNDKVSDSKFMYYYYLSVDEYKGLKPFYTGLRKVVRAETFMNIQLGLPPFKEQQQIAKFLDNATQKMDTLIQKQENLIKLLKEKRQAVISHAVTRGLNPDVKFKDSGVEWLGNVPEHWLIPKIKNMLSIPITDGPHETPEFLDVGVPFVSAEAISKGHINFNKIRGYISKEANKKYSQKYSPKIHDVYMIKSGATTGITAIVEERIDFNIWSPLAVFRTNSKVNPYYLLNYLRSNNFQKAVELYWSYGTQQNIGMNVLENLYMVVPPIEEQQKIASYLDDKTKKIDKLIKKATKSIKLLKEKRTALISAAVTGKIDVRELV